MSDPKTSEPLHSSWTRQVTSIAGSPRRETGPNVFSRNSQGTQGGGVTVLEGRLAVPGVEAPPHDNQQRHAGYAINASDGGSDRRRRHGGHLPERAADLRRRPAIAPYRSGRQGGGPGPLRTQNRGGRGDHRGGLHRRLGRRPADAWRGAGRSVLDRSERQDRSRTRAGDAARTRVAGRGRSPDGRLVRAATGGPRARAAAQGRRSSRRACTTVAFSGLPQFSLFGTDGG